VKVAALWVEDATSAYEEHWCSLFGAYGEKDEFGEVVRSGIYTYGETVHILWNVKIIKVFSYLVGMEIRL
jgi:4-hydroxyphenylpyruvate dioxygenase